MESYDSGNAGLFASMGVMIVLLVFYAALYILLAVCLKRIAEKTGITENSWWAWVPILNFLLLLQIAGKPAWWIVLMLIPIVNFVVSIIVLMEVAKARGKEPWWGIVTAIIPFVGFPYLAFSEDSTSV